MCETSADVQPKTTQSNSFVVTVVVVVVVGGGGCGMGMDGGGGVGKCNMINITETFREILLWYETKTSFAQQKNNDLNLGTSCRKDDV